MFCGGILAGEKKKIIAGLDEGINNEPISFSNHNSSLYGNWKKENKRFQFLYMEKYQRRENTDNFPRLNPISTTGYLFHVKEVFFFLFLFKKSVGLWV